MNAQLQDDLPAKVVDQAIDWVVRLKSGAATEGDRDALRQWRTADPSHEQAWLRLKALEDEFEQVPQAQGATARNALERNRKRRSRRNAIKMLGATLIGGWLSWGVLQTSAWDRLQADYSTEVGERRTVMLENGSRLKLNTATAVDVVFDESRRLIRLHSGELYIETGQDAKVGLPRPLIVETGHGDFAPIGTRFLVRESGDHALLQVMEGAVAMTPGGGTGGPRAIAEAGESYRVSRQLAQPVDRSVAQEPAAWVDGVLVAKQMRLEDFLDELSRHRKGWLRCDPAVADLRISGVYQLDDTDRALRAVENALPVRLESLSRYWVRVTAEARPER